MNATLAHASIILGVFSRGMLGILLAFLIWFTQRGKSNFAARQAAQATLYQLLGVVVAIVLWLGWTIYGLYAAGQVWHGKNFSYPIIGRAIK